MEEPPKEREELEVFELAGRGWSTRRILRYAAAFFEHITTAEIKGIIEATRQLKPAGHEHTTPQF